MARDAGVMHGESVSAAAAQHCWLGAVRTPTRVSEPAVPWRRPQFTHS